MCNSQKKTFTLAPLAPLNVFSPIITLFCKAYHKMFIISIVKTTLSYKAQVRECLLFCVVKTT